MAAADIQAKIDSLEAKLATFAGVRATAFADQSTTFDYDGAVKELGRLRRQLAVTQASSSTRYAATCKGTR